MKRTIRIVILIAGTMGAFIGATVQAVPAADGGPILLCPPGDKKCQQKNPLP